MTSDLRAHRRSIPATGTETWIPILFGWFPFAFVFFIIAAIIFMVQGYQKKGLTILGSTLLGAGIVVLLMLAFNARP